ncbi:hypothetical protein OG21DRAFT_211725 [Imleria badia]|nr:hypothetical protein OG21DRAFT_211725 [Imleria badia]
MMRHQSSTGYAASGGLSQTHPIQVRSCQRRCRGHHNLYVSRDYTATGTRLVSESLGSVHRDRRNWLSDLIPSGLGAVATGAGVCGGAYQGILHIQMKPFTSVLKKAKHPTLETIPSAGWKLPYATDNDDGPISSINTVAVAQITHSAPLLKQ